MKLPLKEKLAYGAADTGTNLLIVPTMTFLFYYYTEVFGLTAAAAGTLFLGVRLADGIVDLLVGVVADRTYTRWGKFRPWILWAAAPLCAMAVLTFTTPPWSPTAKLAYAWMTYLLLMVAFSTMSVPLGALSAVMTNDSHERTHLNSIRLTFAGLAGFLAAFATLPLVHLLSDGGKHLTLGYQRVMLAYAAIAFLLFMTTFAGTQERVPAPPHQVHDVRADLAMLRGNLPWILVTLTATLMVMLTTVRYAATLYYFKHYRLDESGATPFLATISLGTILGAMLSATLARRLGKRGAYQAGAFAAAGASLLIVLAPPTGSFLLEASNLIVSLAMGAVGPLSFSMLADTADYGERQCGRRSTGVIFSGLSFGFKVGMGLGGALTGALLSAFGYIAGSVQSPGTVRGLVWLMSIIPALGLILAGVLISFYPLKDSKDVGVHMRRKSLCERRSM